MDERGWQERRTVSIRGDLVRELRLQRGWTAAQLASRSDLSKRQIEYIEQVKDKKVYPSTVEAIAAKLSVDPACLLAEQPKFPSSLSHTGEHAALPITGGLAITVSMPSEDIANPHLVALFCGIAQKALAEYEFQKQDFMHSPEVRFMSPDELSQAWERFGISNEPIAIYFIPVTGDYGARIWCYGILPYCLHNTLMRSLECQTQLIDEFIIVAQGKNEPSDSVKATVKHYYNFDHDRLATRRSG